MTFYYAPTSLSDRLCGDNEDIILSFKTINQKSVVSICKEKTGRYIVYRSGSKDKVELQFPNKLDKTSWSFFHYSGQWRFGGKANAGFGDLVLKFTNMGTTYRIFQEWNDEGNSSKFGLQVEKPGLKAKYLVVDKSSLLGSLMQLNELPQIKNEADNE